MIEIKNETEKVILVGVSLSDQDDTKESLEELKDLVSTAGAETVGMVIQNREQQHPGTYVGTGKVFELEELIEEKTGINTMTAEDPMKVVAIGTGEFVEFMSGRKDY